MITKKNWNLSHFFIHPSVPKLCETVQIMEVQGELDLPLFFCLFFLSSQDKDNPCLC